MTTICQDIALNVPAADVEQYIMRYFDLHRRNGVIEIPLRVNLRDFGIPAGLALERSVQVLVQKQRDAENINDEIRISWAPADDSPYPAFDGRLIVWGSGAEGESFIELAGEYEPPWGAAGQIFDDAVGHLIADRTAHEFLVTLRDGILAIKETSNAFNR